MKNVTLKIVYVDKDRSTNSFTFSGTPRSCYASFVKNYSENAPRVRNRLGSGSRFDTLFPLEVLSYYLNSAFSLANDGATVEIVQDNNSITISAETLSQSYICTNALGFGKNEMNRMMKVLKTFSKSHEVNERIAFGVYVVNAKTSKDNHRKKRVYYVDGKIVTRTERRILDAIQVGYEASPSKLADIVHLSQGYISKVLKSLRNKSIL